MTVTRTERREVAVLRRNSDAVAQRRRGDPAS
jgi:hypothetical protein